MNEQITITTLIEAPIEKVWGAWNDPQAVKEWNAASPDWHTPQAQNDLREGGSFTYRMEARDGSAGFDFSGTYTAVVPHERIAYVMEDGRTVETTFAEEGGAVRVTTRFDPENENPLEMQRAGWQSILDAFKAYVEQQ